MPAGFTRLTPEVLNWVKKTAGIQDHAGINDKGESLCSLVKFVGGGPAKITSAPGPGCRCDLDHSPRGTGSSPSNAILGLWE